MQYEPGLSRDELIQLATRTYFGNVDAKNMEAALDCFHDGALFCVQTDFTRHSGKEEIRRMFDDFFAAYETIIHRDFTCTVDEANGRIAASFVAELTDADGGVTLLNNTNFWRVRDGKFQEVYVYMSGANVLV
ncbi:nuclear transport factor 2 family protein [Parasphingorhabdus flavimaris]|jgi:ketosteroid isomerase-like protein|uniref:Nuclear transport factor 2 family protein n=1 Tax=Parasphingorhabdus flavimaris TaxID=266812 RepID=A0ABX2N5I1_9SPHN|nr:nuclear transport factor 2 family protein [Parasphingorhabdus flavimaris]NVD28975.1 nuclear transport factor 2 family protein [Parasphingorhabdus flavimaris]|tara:strand:- start:5128 stop:5526 length:399 start_codon:yes stop_codon:yes gene_type:complete